MVHRSLKKHLAAETAILEPYLKKFLAPYLQQRLADTAEGGYSLWHVYEDYWKPFGKLLTDMEAEGVKVNR